METKKEFNDLGINVRRKTEEIQDVLRDLERWETDINKTDEELKKSPNTEELPPIRRQKNSKIVEKKSFSKKNIPLTETDKKRISSFDYKTWETFDVDKALGEIDSGEGDSNSETDEMDLTLEEENLEIEKRKQKANLEKEKGNMLFSKGKYSEAIVAYTRGIQDDPTNAVLPANRAMALLKTGQIGAAEQDCTLSISLDCTYIKAFHRRGTCRFALLKYQLARQDFLKVLELEPGNKYARIELDKVEEEFRKKDKPIAKLEEQIAKLTEFEKLMKPAEVSLLSGAQNSSTIPERNELLNYAQPGIILPIDKPLHLRSKKPLKRMIIEDAKPEVRKSLERPSILEIETRKLSLPEVSSVGSSSGAFSLPCTPLMITPSEPDLPSIPQTSFQFETNWRKLRHWPKLQLSYLKQFPPQDVRRLFKQYIETEIFIGIIRVFHQFFEGNEQLCYDYLTNLTLVGRFGTTVMFLSDEDQQVIKTLIEGLQKHSFCTAENIASLKKLYSI